MSFGIQPFANVGFSSIGENEFVDLSGLVGTSSLGAVTVDLAARYTATGLSATGAVASVTVVFGSVVDLSGLGSTTAIGSVTAKYNAVVLVTGEEISATGHIADDKTVNVWGEMFV